LPGRLLGWLLLLAFLASVVQKWSFQCLGHEVGVDAVLVHAGCGNHFLEVVAGIAGLDEGLLGRLRLRLHNGDVFRTLDSV
jgi:hypothetical protein